MSIFKNIYKMLKQDLYIMKLALSDFCRSLS